MTKRNTLSQAQIVQIAEQSVVPAITEMLHYVNHIDLPIGKRKILATRLLPQSHLWPEGKKAEYAKVSPKYWYTTIREPKFVAICNEIVRSQISVKLAEVWQAFLKNALNGDTTCQTTILREAGILTRDSKDSGDVTVNVAIVEQERKDKLKRGLEQFRYAVVDPTD